MGVMISAYSRLALTEPHTYDGDACYDLGHIHAFAYAGFEQSTRGLADHDRPVTLGREACIGGRCYIQTPETVERKVCSWSYSGYGEWRRELAKAVLDVDVEDVWKDPDAYRDRPFFELLEFADNEGTIGPEAAADLLVDFREHRDQVPVDEIEFSGVTPLPDRWIEALTLAADGGLVRFS